MACHPQQHTRRRMARINLQLGLTPWKADSPARRSVTVGPSRNEPSVPGTGKRLACKEVDDCDD